MRVLPLIVTFMTLIGGCSPPPGSVTDEEALAIHNQAVGEMGSFRYATAFDLLTSLVDARPDDHRFQIDLSIAQLNRQRDGDETAALSRLRTVLDDHPDDLRAMYTAALLEYNFGDLERARQRFDTVALSDPDDAYAAYYAGQMALQLGDVEVAKKWLKEATRRDRYLRSAVYALAQAQRHSGDHDAAAATIQLFSDLESDPRSTIAEIKYTRMGKKATLRPLEQSSPKRPLPEGAIFGVMGSFKVDHPLSPTGSPSITAGDFNGDGSIDILTPACGVAETFFGDPSQWWQKDRVRRLPSSVAESRAMLVGDLDDDGAVEVVVCRLGANAVMRREEGAWQVVTEEFAGIGGGPALTVDGAIVDADHDGDLDIFYVNADGPNQLMNNNGDGTFTDIARGTVLEGRGTGARQVMLGDLDRDRDTDIVVFYDTPPHEAFFNDRLWQWHEATEIQSLLESEVAAAGVADLGDGRSMTVVTHAGDGSLRRWAVDDSGVWSPSILATMPLGQVPAHLEIADVTGTGRQDVLVSSSHGVAVVHLDTGETITTIEDVDLTDGRWTLLLEDPARGPSLVLAGESAVLIWPPGPGRFPFAAIDVSGRRDPGHSLRSNASGLGTQLAARVEDRWTVRTTHRSGSGPGQSLQPVWFGLGGAPAIDFVAVTWSDGVFQTELNLQEGQVHEIVETQRQLSSCPVLFARVDGQWRFISDILGVGGVGFAIGPGEYAPSRPRESFLLPEEVINAADGQIELLIAEPMEEACYLDGGAVTFHDLPEGWGVVVDERMGTSPPEPTGRPIYFRRQIVPTLVTVGGDDVTSDAAKVDGRAIDVGETDPRFLGHLQTPLVITIEFEEDLTQGDPVLVLDGWVEYPYSQTMFAASQAGVTYEPLTLEAMNGDGQWVVVAPSFGYPAGMPRRMAFAMPDLPVGTSRLRLSTNQEIYLDAIAVVMEERCPDAIVTTVLPMEATLESPGFPRRVDGPQRRPGYDFSSVTPLWDTRHLRGLHTAMGDVRELIQRVDDVPVVFGPGEGVRLVFVPPPSRPDRIRHGVLEAMGWCKDMDLYTRDGGVIDPLPRSGPPLDSAAGSLLERTRTRYMSGH